MDIQNGFVSVDASQRKPAKFAAYLSQPVAMWHAVTDEQLAVIADLFPEPAATGRPAMPPRQAMDGVVWLNNTGAKWQDIPASMGQWRTVYGWFDSRNSCGVLQKAVHRLTRVMVDGDGFTTKIHLLADGNGYPLGFQLAGGQVHYSTIVDTVLMTANGLAGRTGKAEAWPVALAGDTGYLAEWIDEYLLDLGISLVIPSVDNEILSGRRVGFDRELYRRRSIVEWLIGWLKEYRRGFSRFEKTAKNFGGMLRITLNQRYVE